MKWHTLFVVISYPAIAHFWGKKIFDYAQSRENGEKLTGAIKEAGRAAGEQLIAVWGLFEDALKSIKSQQYLNWFFRRFLWPYLFEIKTHDLSIRRLLCLILRWFLIKHSI